MKPLKIIRCIGILVERGIYFIQDILNSSGNFLTLDEFQTKFQIKTNVLQYFQMIAAIPSDLKKKAKTRAAPTRDLLETHMLFTGPYSRPRAQFFPIRTDLGR